MFKVGGIVHCRTIVLSSPWGPSKGHACGMRGCKVLVFFVTRGSDRALVLYRQDLGEAKAAMAELYGRMGDIRRKAQASEAMVQVRLSPVFASQRGLLAEYMRRHPG